MNIIIRRRGEFFYTLCEECNRRVVLDGEDIKDAEAVLEGYGWTERGGAVVCPACSDIRGLRLKSAAALVNAPSVALGFNREDVLDELTQMSERLSDIQYFDGDIEEITKALEGDGEEAAEFQMSCSMLNNDVDALLEDFRNYEVGEYFDTFFSAVTRGCIEHFSVYEDDDGGVDFFRLTNFDENYATSRAAEKLKRMKKDELINAAHHCFSVAAALFDVRDRYSRLSIALEVVLKRNGRLLDTVNKLNALYEDASGHFDDFRNNAASEFDKLLFELPAKVWVE